MSQLTTLDILYLPGSYQRARSLIVSRMIDLILSAGLLLMLAPVLLLLVLLVKLTSRGPAIFVQRRIGLNALEFDMYKLRTMVDGADALEKELSEQTGGRTFLKILADPRTTEVGRLLRKYSLDELPQLCNVLRGDMSLVGPRPLLRCDFSKFPRDTRMRRFSAKPGITGLWQVSGRSACSDEERIRLDLHYVDHWSVWMDMKILVRTVPVVIGAEGAT